MDRLAQRIAEMMRREREQANLNPSAPSAQPGTRGIFGRRPVGRQTLSMGEIAPLAPQWAEPTRQHEITAPSEGLDPFPFPLGREAPPVRRAPMPRAVRVGVSPSTSPGAYGNFADFANAQLALRTPSPPLDREPWRQPEATERWAAGMPSTGRGLEPPSAPRRREAAPLSMEDDAWVAARSRVRQQMDAERADARRRVPRPGLPLIAQAWSDPGRRNRRDDR